MNWKMGIAVISVGGLACMGWAHFRTQESRLNEMRAEMHGLSQQLVDSKSQRAPIPQLLEHLSARTSPESPSKPLGISPEPHAGDPDTQATTAARPKPPLSASAVNDRFDATYKSEPVDSQWARAAQQKATTAISTLLPAGSELRSLDCRTSICRIETSHGDAEQYHAFMAKAFLGTDRPVWNAGMYSSPVYEGSSGDPWIVVTYLAKEGQTLPLVD